MEVKDVTSLILPDTPTVQDLPSKASSSGGERVKETPYHTDKSRDVVTVSHQAKSVVGNDARTKANSAIEIVNIANEATEKIGALLKSVSGFTDQAPSLSADRRKLLEGEAASVVHAIRATALASSSSGVRPLAGDEIRLQIEETLGRSLDVILPDDATRAFGLGKLEFSTKESIISTRASIEMAKQSFERLRIQVGEAVQNVREANGALDIAIQNTEASGNSIRDVDVALKLTGSTKSLIRELPDAALASIGESDPKFLAGLR